MNYSTRGGSGSSLSVPSTSAYVVSPTTLPNKTLSEWNHEASAFVVLIIQWRPVLFNSFIKLTHDQKRSPMSRPAQKCLPPHREWRSSCFVVVVRVMNFRGVHRMPWFIMNMWLQAVCEARKIFLNFFISKYLQKTFPFSLKYSTTSRFVCRSSE